MALTLVFISMGLVCCTDVMNLCFVLVSPKDLLSLIYFCIPDHFRPQLNVNPIICMAQPSNREAYQCTAGSKSTLLAKTREATC